MFTVCYSLLNKRRLGGEQSRVSQLGARPPRQQCDHADGGGAAGRIISYDHTVTVRVPSSEFLKPKFPVGIYPRVLASCTSRKGL